MLKMLLVLMRAFPIVLLVLLAFAASADDLGALKAPAERYVASMKAALALQEDSACSDTIAKAEEYAAAKVAYYEAAQQAMPALLSFVTGQDSDSSDGKELTDTFRGFGADKDSETTRLLEAKLNQCPTSSQRDRAQLSVERARRKAEQFQRRLRSTGRHSKRS